MIVPVEQTLLPFLDELRLAHTARSHDLQNAGLRARPSVIENREFARATNGIVARARELRPESYDAAIGLGVSLRGLTRTVALDAGEYGVNVNVVMPGIVETPRMHKLCEEKARTRGWTKERVYQEYVDEMALKSVTTPQDVADAVLFLASDEARNITGQELTVDGGWDV